MGFFFSFFLYLFFFLSFFFLICLPSNGLATAPLPVFALFWLHVSTRAKEKWWGGGKEKGKIPRDRKPLALEVGQQDCAGEKVLSWEICVCCWHSYSFLCEAGPQPLGKVCADGSRCVARLAVPAWGGQLHSRNHVAVLDANLIDPTERFIVSCRQTPLSPASQGHGLAVGPGSFPYSPCHLLRGMEKLWCSRWHNHAFCSMWS